MKWKALSDSWRIEAMNELGVNSTRLAETVVRHNRNRIGRYFISKNNFLIVIFLNIWKTNEDCCTHRIFHPIVGCSLCKRSGSWRKKSVGLRSEWLVYEYGFVDCVQCDSAILLDCWSLLCTIPKPTYLVPNQLQVTNHPVLHLGYVLQKMISKLYYNYLRFITTVVTYYQY